jgi:hypothetical protein
VRHAARLAPNAILHVAAQMDPHGEADAADVENASRLTPTIRSTTRARQAYGERCPHSTGAGNLRASSRP